MRLTFLLPESDDAVQCHGHVIHVARSPIDDDRSELNHRSTCEDRGRPRNGGKKQGDSQHGHRRSTGSCMRPEGSLIIYMEKPVLQSRLEVLTQLRLGQGSQEVCTMYDDVPIPNARDTPLEVLLDRRRFIAGCAAIQVLGEEAYDFGTVHRHRSRERVPGTCGPKYVLV